MKPTVAQLRNSCSKFAASMLQKLRANQHKNGWQDMPVWDLYKRLEDEKLELLLAIVANDADAIKKEAADVGNFAMMISENAGTNETSQAS